MTTMYTLYTDTHRQLYEEWFLPSFEKHMGDIVDLEAKEMPQISASGSFYSEGWQETMQYKTDIITQAIEDHRDDVFLFVDCDVQFFGDVSEPMLNALQGKDLVGQNDGAMLCAGVIAVRANPIAKALWRTIKIRSPEYGCDQRALNAILNAHVNRGSIEWGKLDWDQFFNYRRLTEQDVVWTPDMDLHIPEQTLDNMLLHHANFTVGVQNKIIMMERIREQKNQRLQTTA